MKLQLPTKFNVNLKRFAWIVRVFAPKFSELKFFFRALMMFMIFMTVVFFAQMISKPAHAAVEDGTCNEVLSTIPNYFANIPVWGKGYVTDRYYPLGSSNACNYFSASPSGGSTATAAGGNATGYHNVQNYAQDPNSPFVMYDLGAMGRITNASANLYKTPAASPNEVVQYYASRATGRTLAASPTSGREVLAPVFLLSQMFRNIAYGIIIIILITSSLSILLGALGSGEQKLSLVNLIMNAGVTLVLVTFFYEIAAVIYDLVVNYGNQIVASIMEPYINAKVILERLQPGGDLNVSMLINTFEFVGITDGLNNVIQNVFAGFYPAVNQTAGALGRNVVPTPGPGAGVAGEFLGMMGGFVSTFANMVISSLLGSKEVFDAVLSFTIFFINMKIFINLLDAFVRVNLYVAFGPIMMLRGLNKGYDEIKNTFMLIATYCAVYPVTFFFILLGAACANIFIRPNNKTGGTQEVSKTVLCVYSNNDPEYTEGGIINRWGADSAITHFLGIGDPARDDPANFRYRNLINQNIFDTTPSAYSKDGKRNCRSNLFPTPFTFVPAPFGNYGNRLLQIQTTDTLIRTFMAIAFLVLASRTPKLLVELTGVKELSSLQGIGRSFGAGLKPFLGIGAFTLGASVPLGLGVLKRAVNTKLPVMGSINDVYKRMADNSPANFQKMAADYSKNSSQLESNLVAQGVNPADARAIAATTVSNSMAFQFKDLTSKMNSFGEAIGGLVGAVNGAAAQIQGFARELRTFIEISAIDEL